MKLLMRKSMKMMAMVMISGLMAGQLLAMDFSVKTTAELAEMRGTMQSASLEERDAFKTEWQKRLAAMSPETRSKYMGPPDAAPRDGSGYGTKGMNGKKSGNGKQGQYNQKNSSQNGYGQNQNYRMIAAHSSAFGNTNKHRMNTGGKHVQASYYPYQTSSANGSDK